MTAARRKAVPKKPLAVVLPGGVVVHADANTIPPDTCHLSHCPDAPAPGPTGLCAEHLRRAKVYQMKRDEQGIEWGACLRGCTGWCELGKWRTEGGSKEFVRPTSGCEHLPAHMINLARGIVRRRAFVDDE